jgi:hypothetical protein
MEGMQAFEYVLVAMSLLALVGLGIMVFRALMRPVVVLGVIAVLGWLLYFYENFSVDTASNDVIINEQTEKQEGK